MPVAPLTGLALAAAVDLARATVDGHEVRFYRSALPRGELNEAAIGVTFLPTAPGWADVTSTVLLSSGATVTHDGTGHTIALTVADESRLAWADDLAVAVVARHWFPSTLGWGQYYLVAWGYLDGSDRQRLGLGLDQTGERLATYHGYWDLSPVEALRLGRRNLATSASIAAASPALADPLAEVPYGEYISQDDCAPQKILDGNADTVAVADVIADPAVPALGSIPWLNIHRAYGPFSPGIAVGGEPRFIEVAAGQNVTASWGSFQGDGPIPALEGHGSAFRNDGQVQSYTEEEIAAPGNRVYVVLAKANPGHPNELRGVQWNLSTGGDRPLRVAFRYKAWETGSIGKAMFATHGTSSGKLVLGSSWQEYSASLDGAGGNILVIRFQGGDNSDATALLTDTRFAIDDLRVSVGYSDMAAPAKASLCIDNGAGAEHVIRVAGFIAPWEDWRIPADDTVVFCDDAATYRAKFGTSSSRTVYQLKGIFGADFFFKPGQGRVKFAWASNDNRTDYDDAGLTTISEVNFAFANGGVPWLASQALSRNQAPVGTSTMTTEDFPHPGLAPVGGYGAAYWWLDLGAYRAPTLTANIDAGALRLPVDDIDAYTFAGFGTIGAERVWWSDKDAAGLIVIARGIGGTTAAAHNAGDAVTPDAYGGQYQNAGTPQRGWNVDRIVVRRKPGRARILAGAVLTSNLSAPGNPAEGGARWERHPDWRIVQRWHDPQDAAGVIDLNLAALLGGVREVRHVCVVIDAMERVGGVPQRGKLNEVQVFEARMAAGSSGAWAAKDASDLGGVLGYLLTQKAGMPASKVALALQANGAPIPTPAIGDLPVAPTTAAQAIRSLATSGFLRVWLDRANTATIAAAPESPVYAPTTPYFALDATNLLGEFSLTWATAHRVAQVRVSAREATSLRTYSTQYPRRAARLGATTEIRDALVRTATDVYAIAEARFRAENARRQLTVTTGALPWLEAGQRVLLNSPDIDLGGQGEGVNFAVSGYSIRIGIDDGGPTWETALTLQELAL